MYKITPIPCRTSPVCKSLFPLFEEWKIAQKNEDTTITFPKKSKDGTPQLNTFKCSFCRDGVTSLAGNVLKSHNPQVHLMFILKESNVVDKKSGTIVAETNEIVDLEEVIYLNKIHQLQ